jgi:UDP-GlcNAc:undecaprenyl-phosphate GlcNAc-1-phosphate transferase
MFLIFYLSSLPAGDPLLEKIRLPFGLEHFFGYAAFSFFLYRALSGGISPWRGGAAGWTLFMALLYGIFDEYYQGFVPGRSAAIPDVLMDAAGVASALLLIRAGSLLAPKVKGAPATETQGEKAAEIVERPPPWGLLIYLLLVSGSLLVFPFTLKVGLLLAAVTLLVLTGLLNHYRITGRRFLLLGQASAAVLLVFGNRGSLLNLVEYFGRYRVPVFFTLFLAAVWVLLMSNAFQLQDGLDGLAAAITAVMGVALGVLLSLHARYLIAGVALIVLGGCLGLYPYNLRPAVIPLDRTGGMLLGFSLAALYLFRIDAPLALYLVPGSFLLFIYPAAEITLHFLGKLPFQNTIRPSGRGAGKPPLSKRVRRAVYLFYLLLFAAAIAVLFSFHIPFIPAAVFLLVLFAAPGAYYLIRACT